MGDSLGCQCRCYRPFGCGEINTRGSAVINSKPAKCPQCGETSPYSKRRSSHYCAECDIVFDTPKPAVEPQTIFLSYAHKSELEEDLVLRYFRWVDFQDRLSQTTRGAQQTAVPIAVKACKTRSLEGGNDELACDEMSLNFRYVTHGNLCFYAVS